MPTVLITGLNGFVAVHTAVRFLKEGWTVRGTIRSSDKASKVKSLPALKDAFETGKAEIVIVADLVEGDFTEALQGVDAIAHCASPWHFNGKTWESYRDPAVKGTTNILEQAAKVDSVKAVSVVSSFAAVGNFDKPASEQIGTVYTGQDWLNWTEEDCRAVTAETGGPVKWYCVSKKMAEEAAINLHKTLKPQYSLATTGPCVILGPAINYAPGTTAEELINGDISTKDTFNALAAGKDATVPGTPFPIYVDVRNVADANYGAIVNKATGRFPLCNDVFDYQSLANRARELYPELDESIPLGNPEDQPSKKTYTLDGSKAVKELGVEYIQKDQMIKDIMEQFITLGVVKA